MATLVEARVKQGQRARGARPSLARAAVAAHTLHVFETELGWIAALGRDGALVQLSIGCDTPAAAVERLNPDWAADAVSARWCVELERRLCAYAAGKPVDFADVAVLDEDRTPFQRRVLDCCRRIAYGQTLSYGELARRAGRPGAARAVGNTMASNRLPLVIPCHRVVHADGRIGHFSAPQGSRMKRRLLDLER